MLHRVIIPLLPVHSIHITHYYYYQYHLSMVVAVIPTNTNFICLLTMLAGSRKVTHYMNTILSFVPHPGNTIQFIEHSYTLSTLVKINPLSLHVTTRNY